MTSLLRIDSSARHDGSASRELSSRLIQRLRESNPNIDVATRDLTTGVPIITEEILHAMWAAPDERTTDQGDTLALADALIAELVDADALVIGLPIYNFGPPAALKAWADLVARAGSTFRYTETGPEGLIADKPVYVIVASGGVPVGSPMDFSSTWLTTFLGFLGITNVTIIAADQLNADPDNALDAARARVDTVKLAA